MNNVRNILCPPALTYPCHSVRALNRRLPGWKQGNLASSPRGGQGPFARDAELAQLESYLFAADEPLSLRRLASLLHWPSDEVRRHLKRLSALYEHAQSSFHIVELAGGYQLRTREEFLPWLLKLQPSPVLHLSPAAIKFVPND